MNDDIIDDYTAFVDHASKNELKDYKDELIARKVNKNIFNFIKYNNTNILINIFIYIRMIKMKIRKKHLNQKTLRMEMKNLYYQSI